MKQTKERLFHHVTVSVFCKPNDDREAILCGLDLLSPVPAADLLRQDPERDPDHGYVHHRLKDSDLMVQDTLTDQGTMTIFTLYFRRMSSVNAVAGMFRETLSEEELAQHREDSASLLDADGRMSFRLDKEALMRGQVRLTASGECYQVKASIAAYPKNEERIIEALKRILRP
jgi:hypothetical protein